MCTSRPRVRRSCFQDQREQDSSPTSLCGLRLMAAVPQPESPSGTPIPRVHAGQAAPLRAEAHVVSPSRERRRLRWKFCGSHHLLLERSDT